MLKSGSDSETPATSPSAVSATHAKSSSSTGPSSLAIDAISPSVGGTKPQFPDHALT